MTEIIRFLNKPQADSLRVHRVKYLKATRNTFNGMTWEQEIDGIQVLA
jgi:hypothetical protein